MQLKKGSIKDDLRKLTQIIRKLEQELTFSSRNNYRCCGMTYAQCHLLIEIGENPGAAPKMLAESLNLEKSTISRAAENLIEKGLIIRKESETDRRSVRLFLTDAGTEKFSDVNDYCDSFYNKFLESTGYKNIYQLIKETEDFYEKLSEYNKNNRRCCIG